MSVSFVRAAMPTPHVRPIMLLLIVIILASVAGCQTTLVSVTSSPVAASSPAVLARATRLPRAIPTQNPTATPTSSPAPTTAVTAPPQAGAAAIDSGTALIKIGQSVEGRDIVAHHFGTGPRSLLLVGGMHGGWEENTVTLVSEMIVHFQANPQDILPGLSLVLVPVANPDGMAHGRVEAGRFNANQVDLNRNWGCNWSAEARWRDQAVNAGPRPFSEPETSALSAFIQVLRPAAVLFYHSAAGGIFAGNCGGDHGSMLMSQVLGEATGYSYGQPFTAYRVTGTAASWVDGLGIPAADVELVTWTDSEFERNLRGVMALQRWLAG